MIIYEEKRSRTSYQWLEGDTRSRVNYHCLWEARSKAI